MSTSWTSSVFTYNKEVMLPVTYDRGNKDLRGKRVESTQTVIVKLRKHVFFKNIKIRS